MSPIVIVGSGLAGYTLARELRKLDGCIPIMLITRDDGAVYSKPMLSSAYATNKTPHSLISASADNIATDLNITINTRCEVLGINPTERTINTSHGCFPYCNLVLALGADPIRPVLAGNATDNILSVNDLSDYRRFRDLANGKTVIAIIGAGLIGCEFANDFHLAGFQVRIIGRTLYPLQGLIPFEIADALQTALHDVQWLCPSIVNAVWKEDKHFILECANSNVVRAELVLCAIGLSPRTALARVAGLSVDAGISVDNTLQTSSPHIYALGDCAQIEGRVLPYIMPLMQSARILAQNLSGIPSRVIFPHMPIIIKTSVYPIVALPSTLDITTEWVCEESSKHGLRFVQLDAQGRIRGFALSGDKTTQRASMLGRLAGH